MDTGLNTTLWYVLDAMTPPQKDYNKVLKPDPNEIDGEVVINEARPASDRSARTQDNSPLKKPLKFVHVSEVVLQLLDV